MVIRKKNVKVGLFYFVGDTKHERNEMIVLSHSIDSVHAQVVSTIM